MDIITSKRNGGVQKIADIVTMEDLHQMCLKGAEDAERRRILKEAEKELINEKNQIISEEKEIDNYCDIVLNSSMSESCTTNMSYKFHFANARNAFKFMAQRLAMRAGSTYLEQPWHEDVINWLESGSGRWLYICGNSGIGKTWITTCIFKLIALKLGIASRFLKLDRMNVVDNWKAYINNDIIVLDDAGLEPSFTENFSKVDPYNTIINDAYNKGKCIIITSNFTPEELCEKRYGSMTYSRLQDRMTYIKIVNGYSFRSDHLHAIKYEQKGNKTERTELGKIDKYKNF